MTTAALTIALAATLGVAIEYRRRYLRARRQHMAALRVGLRWSERAESAETRLAEFLETDGSRVRT